jgi:hypothetical protein
MMISEDPAAHRDIGHKAEDQQSLASSALLGECLFQCLHSHFSAWRLEQRMPDGRLNSH